MNEMDTGLIILVVMATLLFPFWGYTIIPSLCKKDPPPVPFEEVNLPDIVAKTDPGDMVLPSMEQELFDYDAYEQALQDTQAKGLEDMQAVRREILGHD